MEKVTLETIRQKKSKGEKIIMLTAYDFSTARILDDMDIDIVLVGDSLGMVFLGYENTLPVTIDEMIYHTKAVARAIKKSFLLVDMPFMSYQVSENEAVYNAGKIIKEGNANGVKIEGGAELTGAIKKIINCGIPVCGHIGMTPQHINNFSGFKVQGKTKEKTVKLVEDALALQDAGVFGIVIECVPEEVAFFITEKLSIPTIGIGAGKNCSGQVLVINDILGYSNDFKPKFVKKYADLNAGIKTAVSEFISEVRSEKFPDKAHSFHLPDNALPEIQFSHTALQDLKNQN